MLRHEEAVAMGKHKAKPNYRRRLLRLPDLDHCKRAVLNSLGSPASRRVYEYAIDQFIAWYCSEPRLAFNHFLHYQPCAAALLKKSKKMPWFAPLLQHFSR
jgi:hypothetical protein